MHVTASPDPSVAATDNRTGKYLTFLVDREEFGVNVLKVREIMRIQEITTMPRTPEWMKGVINLRGKIIPVVDLRLKFGLADSPYTERTCIIVVQVRVGPELLSMGIIVDEVSEVLSMNAADIEDTPDFGASVDTGYILGMAKVKGRVKILLDIDKVLSGQEIRRLETALQ
jgi:purine-binding chemotaxis protein CheW